MTDAAKEAAGRRKATTAVYGARPLRRTIERRIENPLAKRILGGEFADGDVVQVDFAGDEFAFTKAAADIRETREPEPAHA